VFFRTLLITLHRVLALDSDDDGSCDGQSHAEETPSPVVDVENVIFERKVYLRAALKLLDQRDQILDEKTPERSVADVIKYGRLCIPTSPLTIILGTLKKATGSSVTRAWKEKYVEVRHGIFSYGDLTGWGQTVNWKTIRLITKDIRCYPVKSATFPDRGVFALRESNGQKRLWMAESLGEMIAWVDAIKTAMIGSAGDFIEDTDNDCSQVGSEVTRQNKSNESSDSASLSSLAPVQLWHKSEYVGNDDRDYFLGLPTYLSAEIRKYIFLQTAISNAPSSDAYRELLELYISEPHFTVPISFIKVGVLSNI
jgi:hypothetical protein